MIPTSEPAWTPTAPSAATPQSSDDIDSPEVTTPEEPFEPTPPSE